MTDPKPVMYAEPLMAQAISAEYRAELQAGSGDSRNLAFIYSIPLYLDPPRTGQPAAVNTAPAAGHAQGSVEQRPLRVEEVLTRMRQAPNRLWQSDLMGDRISIHRMREILTFAMEIQRLGGQNDGL